MAAYVISGTGPTANTTAATRGIVKAEANGTNPSPVKVYEWAVGPGAAAEDSNYTVRPIRQSTAGTWTTTNLPQPLDSSVSTTSTIMPVGGINSTAAGTAGAILGGFGFNQRGGFRWVAVPGGELIIPGTAANGIIIEYKTVQGSAANEGCMYVMM